MVRDSVVALLAERLNNRTDLNDAIILEMQLAQSIRLEQNGRFQPWFMLTTRVIFPTTANVETVSAPADFVMEVEEQGLWVLNPDTAVWGKLGKVSEEVGMGLYTATGLPLKYSLTNDTIVLYPTPDDAYSIRMRYAGAQPDLSTNIENDWLKYATDLMIAEVGYAIASTKMQNDKLASAFAVDKEKAWQRLWLMHEARQHVNQNYSMGDTV